MLPCSFSYFQTLIAAHSLCTDCSFIPRRSPCGGEHNKRKYRGSLGDTSKDASSISTTPLFSFHTHTGRICWNSLAGRWFMARCCQRIISSWGLFMMTLQVESVRWGLWSKGNTGWGEGKKGGKTASKTQRGHANPIQSKSLDFVCFSATLISCIRLDNVWNYAPAAIIATNIIQQPGLTEC